MDTARRADPNWPNKTGYLIPCAVMLGSGRGELAGGKLITAGDRLGHRVVRVPLCILLFVLCILLISIDVATVHFVCCSVKLPLIPTKSFCLFFHILLPTPIGGGTIERPRGPFVAGHGQTTTPFFNF